MPSDYKGLNIRFEGDASGLIAALRQIDSETERTTSGLSRINAALKLDPTNVNLYKAQAQEYGKVAESQKKRVEELQSAIDKEKAAIATSRKELDNKAAALRRAQGAQEYYTKYGTENAILSEKELAEAVETAQAEYDKAEAALNRHNEALKDAKRDLELAKTAQEQYEKATDASNRKVESLTHKLGQAGAALKSYSEGTSIAADKLMELGTGLSIVSGAMLLGFGRGVLTETEQFGNAISQIGGYLNITGFQLERMSDLALQFGKDTKFSATEAANAISELAKGGMTQAQIEGGALDATLQLATAGNIGLAQAAEVAVQAINVFGLSAENSSMIADALAGAANRSVAEIGDLSSSFRYVSGWAGLADYSINDVAGALGLLADNGLQGEMAGTGLRNVLQRLGAPTKEAKELLDAYGVEVYDASGKMKPLVELVAELRDGFSGLDDATRNETLNTIFGARGLPAAIALMEAGTDQLEDYIGATKRVGYAEEMAQAQMGDLGWALEYLRGEFETAQVNIGQAFTPAIIELAEAAENLLASFNNLSRADQQKLANTLLAIVGLGPGLVFIATAFKKISAAGSALGGVARVTDTFLMSMKTGSSVTEALADGLVEVSDGALSSSKAMAAVTGNLALLGVAATAFIALKLWQEIEKDRQRTENLNTSLDKARELLAGKGPNTNKLADSIYASGKAARETKVDVDQMLQSLTNFFDKVDEVYAGVEADSAQLNYAAQVIKDLGGNADASAEDQAKLNAALAVYNDYAGTNYALHSDTGTVIYDENDAVIHLEQSIYRLVEAQKAQARADAVQSLLTDAYKEQIQAQQTLTDARNKYFDIIDRRQRGETGIEVSDYALDQARYAYQDARDAAIAADLAVDGLTESLEEQTQAAMEAQEAIHNALAEHIVEFDTLGEALEEAHLNVNDFTGLTETEFAEMVEAAKGDMGVLAGFLADWLKDHGDIEVDFEGDASDVEDAARDAEDATRRVPTEWETKFLADSSAVDNAVSRVKEKLRALDGTTANVRIQAYKDGPAKGLVATGGIRTHADGGIAAYANGFRYHAGGSIVNVPGTGYPLDWVGEAGAEAIVPLTNRRYSQPFIDLIADGVAARMGSGSSYNLYINGARVNDDPQIRGQFIDLMQTLVRKGAMNVG